MIKSRLWWNDFLSFCFSYVFIFEISYKQVLLRTFSKDWIKKKQNRQQQQQQWKKNGKKNIGITFLHAYICILVEWRNHSIWKIAVKTRRKIIIIIKEIRSENNNVKYIHIYNRYTNSLWNISLHVVACALLLLYNNPCYNCYFSLIPFSVFNLL